MSVESTRTINGWVSPERKGNGLLLITEARLSQVGVWGIKKNLIITVIGINSAYLYLLHFS